MDQDPRVRTFTKKISKIVFDHAIHTAAEGAILRINVAEYERREQENNLRCKQAIADHDHAMSQLAERFSVRDAEDKDKLALFEQENRRLKGIEDSVSELQLKYIEARLYIQRLVENEEKMLEEVKNKNREVIHHKAAYDAVVAHSQAKLTEAQTTLQKTQDATQHEISVLKAKMARFQSTNTTLQQSLDAKEKENDQLRNTVQELLRKLEVSDRH